MRYRIMAIKYGYMEVDVPDNNEKEALQLAENAPDLLLFQPSKKVTEGSMDTIEM